LHVLLFIKLGVITSVLLQALPVWRAMPSAVQVLDTQLATQLAGIWLAAMGLVSLAWCLRDALRTRRLRLASGASGA
jgi:hypothetical protein